MKYWQQYLALLEDLQNGNYENASRELHAWRLKLEARFDFELEWMRRLLAARLALKTNQESVAQELFVGNPSKLPLELQAEVYFVRGLAHYERSEFTDGVLCFESAIPLYRQLDNAYRELLCDFNAITGAECAGAIDSQIEIAKLVALGFRANALAAKDQRCLRFAHAAEREKSFLCQREGNLNAARDAIIRARKFYEQMGPLSDFHICLLQEADVSLDLDDKQAARAAFDLVLDPIDPRVKFPKAFVAWRLDLIEKPDATQFLVVPTWEKKLSAPKGEQQEFCWDRSKGEIFINGLLFQVKPDSLESRLITILSDGRRSKELLCTALWPEFAHNALVENRLHRLISRINKKIPQLILWSSGYYSLRRTSMAS